MKHSNDLNGTYRVTWENQYYIVLMKNGVGNRCIKLEDFTHLIPIQFISCCFDINSGIRTEYEPATEKECNWLSACIKADRLVDISQIVSDEFSLYIN